MKRLLTTLVILTGLFGAGGAVWADAESDAHKGWEAFKSRDYATALKVWRPLAEQGNADAQYALGELYYYGKGVTQDKTGSSTFQVDLMNSGSGAAIR